MAPNGKHTKEGPAPCLLRKREHQRERRGVISHCPEEDIPEGGPFQRARSGIANSIINGGGSRHSLTEGERRGDSLPRKEASTRSSTPCPVPRENDLDKAAVTHRPNGFNEGRHHDSLGRETLHCLDYFQKK